MITYEATRGGTLHLALFSDDPLTEAGAFARTSGSCDSQVGQRVWRTILL